jgi:hypothetical protein
MSETGRGGGRARRSAGGGPPRVAPTPRGWWPSVDRLFFRILKWIATIAALGVALRFLVKGDGLEALLLVGAVLYVLGVGPFRYLLGRGPRDPDE